MKKKLGTLLVLVIIPIFTLLYVHNIGAQSSNGLIISPPYLDHKLNAGESFEQEFAITNQTGKDDEFVIESREISIDKDGQYFVPSGRDSENNTSSMETNGWMEITPKTIQLTQGERKTFKVIFNLPSNSPTKGYYTELAIFSSKNMQTQQLAGGQAAIQSEIVIPLAINLVGFAPEIRSLKEISFKTDKNLYEYTPVIFTTKLENTGNVHIIPKGQIFISQDPEFKSNVDSLVFNHAEQNLFNGSGREYNNIWNNATLSFDDQGKFTINWQDLSKIRFGQYYAQLSVVWDGANGKEFTSAVTSFWIIPWKLILIIVAIIILILYLIFRKNKKNNKKEIEN